MRQTAIAVEPAQLVGPARHAHAQQRQQRGRARSGRTAPRPMARPTGGSHSHSPSQDSARNRPTAVAIDASAGHSRSHRIDQRARLSARSSTPARLGGARLWLRSGAGTFGQVRSPATRICASSASISRIRTAALGKRKAPTDQNNGIGSWFTPSITARAAGDRARSMRRPRGGAAPAPIRLPAPALPAPAARVL